MSGPTGPSGLVGGRWRAIRGFVWLLLVGAGCSGLPGAESLPQLPGRQAPEQWEPSVEATADEDPAEL